MQARQSVTSCRVNEPAGKSEKSSTSFGALGLTAAAFDLVVGFAVLTAAPFDLAAAFEGLAAADFLAFAAGALALVFLAAAAFAVFLAAPAFAFVAAILAPKI